MKTKHFAQLVALSALWGASFLFMRLGAAEFGPVALCALRVGLASLALLPLLVWRGQAGALRQRRPGHEATLSCSQAAPARLASAALFQKACQPAAGAMQSMVSGPRSVAATSGNSAAATR